MVTHRSKLGDPLTKTELEILRCRCEKDMTSEEVAVYLHLANQTVKNYITAIFQKLGNRRMTNLCWKLGRHSKQMSATDITVVIIDNIQFKLGSGTYRFHNSRDAHQRKMLNADGFPIAGERIDD